MSASSGSRRDVINPLGCLAVLTMIGGDMAMLQMTRGEGELCGSWVFVCPLLQIIVVVIRRILRLLGCLVDGSGSPGDSAADAGAAEILLLCAN